MNEIRIASQEYAQSVKAPIGIEQRKSRVVKRLDKCYYNSNGHYSQYGVPLAGFEPAILPLAKGLFCPLNYRGGTTEWGVTDRLLPLTTLYVSLINFVPSLPVTCSGNLYTRSKRMPSQLNMLAEECCELSIAALKQYRVQNGAGIEKLTEELADVEIVSEQIIYCCNLREQVDEWKEKKLRRLAHLLEAI